MSLSSLNSSSAEIIVLILLVRTLSGAAIFVSLDY
jgi:hypothetical protein